MDVRIFGWTISADSQRLLLRDAETILKSPPVIVLGGIYPTEFPCSAESLYSSAARASSFAVPHPY
jgi:hypothetical protein